MDFAITWDYLCPFARNANEAVTRGLRDGEDWNVTFQAFSLSQVHLEEGDLDVWNRSDEDLPSGVLALAWGVAIRDEFSDAFLDAHDALFAARHDEGLDINDESVIREAVASAGLDPDEVAKVVATGKSLARVGEEHTAGVDRHAVFGVPTFIAADEAVFVRVMTRGDVDAVRRALELIGWTDLNEFKRTRIPR